MSQALGFAAEKKAKRYLQSQGLQCIGSNYACRAGEIDLIMRDADCVVFVEVRARSSARFGSALASVTYNKQQKIIKAALLYLAQCKLHHTHPIRFDVVSFEGKAAHISWIKNAFGAEF